MAYVRHTWYLGASPGQWEQHLALANTSTEFHYSLDWLAIHFLYFENVFTKHTTKYETLTIRFRISREFRSDSDQKSMIDYFRLIGWKTIDFFSIMEFRSLNFGMIKWSIFSDFFRIFPDFLWFFFLTSEYAKWKHATLQTPKEKFPFHFSIYLLLLLRTVSLDQFFETDWSINQSFFDLFQLINQIFRFIKIIDRRLKSIKKLSIIGITRISCFFNAAKK